MSTAPASLTTQPLIVELLTEELPPKALQRLGTAFAQGLEDTLRKLNMLPEGCAVTAFATPRRLAALFSAVVHQAEPQPFTEKLMPAKIGFTDKNELSPALQKKLAAKGLEHLARNDLIIESDGKQDYILAKGVAPGASLQDALQQALDDAINALPIPKVMRYQLADGHTSVRFVRPAHRLVALWGDRVIPVHTLGLQAGRETLGHRFMCKQPITVHSAAGYAEQLLHEGRVVASFEERRELIRNELLAQARALHATIGDEPQTWELLDEVTALVEHPTVYVGQFDAQFLQVPSECLILTMRLNQKYFPLFDPDTGKLTHRFLIVSNMQVGDPVNIVQGNERVVRPRLADAQFFYQTDLKTPLEDRVPSLSSSVYHNKLGSQLQRVQRVRDLARHVAAQLNADTALADRAALLAKADLNSSMVGEFPELQGIMGAYYAQAGHEDSRVVYALRQQYQIRIDAPVTHDTLIAAVLFIAERIETLVGIWGIGLAPTGERDPYALRRAALGLISAYEQLHAAGLLPVADTHRLELGELLSTAALAFSTGTLSATTTQEVKAFIYERYRNQLSGTHDRQVVDAVLALEPALHQIQARVQACSQFAASNDAASLAAANKRISNLLKKADDTIGDIDASLLVEPAEQALAQVVTELGPRATALAGEGDFAGSLSAMAQARSAVDAFFNDVMVMADDPKIRANRLALLARVHQLMNQVADIARLAQ
ncbi:MAG: glycine--tRNA ligase subunit beta [Burkholderiaceae bacterium]